MILCFRAHLLCGTGKYRIVVPSGYLNQNRISLHHAVHNQSDATSPSRPIVLSGLFGSFRPSPISFDDGDHPFSSLKMGRNLSEIVHYPSDDKERDHI